MALGNPILDLGFISEGKKFEVEAPQQVTSSETGLTQRGGRSRFSN